MTAVAPTRTEGGAPRGRPRKIVVWCCLVELMEPEGPDGTPHAPGCTGMPSAVERMSCCGAVRRHGHAQGCRLRTG